MQILWLILERLAPHETCREKGNIGAFGERRRFAEMCVITFVGSYVFH